MGDRRLYLVPQYFILLQSSMLLLVILAMDYCTIQALSITRDPDTNSQPTIIPSLAHSQSPTQPLSTHNGASQNHKLSIIELTTTMTATTKIHNIEDNIQYNHTVEEYNNSAPTALPDDLNITLNGVTSADTATDEPQTALSEWSETITNMLIMAFLGGVIVKYLKVGKVVRELGTVAHEAIINHRRNKRSRDERRDSISTCLFKSHQDIRGAGSTHPSPAHGALLRIKADQYVAEDQITLDSINDTIWGQVVEGRPEGDERRHTQDLRQYRSAIEMRYKTSPLHLPYLLLPRRHSFDALDSARCNSDRSTCARSNHARSNRGRSQPTYVTSDNKRNSIACSPPQTDSDDGRLRDVDCESMLDYGLLQINIENYDDLISEDKDSIMSECSSDQSTNQSTGFHITS